MTPLDVVIAAIRKRYFAPRPSARYSPDLCRFFIDMTRAIRRDGHLRAGPEQLCSACGKEVEPEGHRWECTGRGTGRGFDPAQLLAEGKARIVARHRRAKAAAQKTKRSKPKPATKKTKRAARKVPA